MTKEIKGDTVLKLLAEAWNAYLKEYNEVSSVPGKSNADDLKEFKRLVYGAENIIKAKQWREYLKRNEAT